MPRPFYQSLADTLLGTIGRGQAPYASWEDVEEMARRFEEQGGSWYRLAHGNPDDVVLYKALARDALRYESEMGAEDKDA